MTRPPLYILARDHHHALRSILSTMDALDCLRKQDVITQEDKDQMKTLSETARLAVALSYETWGTNPHDTPDDVEAKYKELH